jgi:hypothetical protein
VSNPFYGDTPGRDEIYATGFRNPWRFSFDRGTGQLYVGDVGQGAREEVDIVTLGGNYGWRVFEGTNCTGLDPSLCSVGGFTAPIAEYATHVGGRCAITGGYVYRGTKSSLPIGSYVFADYCTGEIFLLESGATQLLLDTALNISSFGEDEAGEIYFVGQGGAVQRITSIQQQPPVYEGYLDEASCDVIFGWAADRNRLNTAVSVDIYDGGNKIATVTADQPRSDVGAYLGDNGLHGFALATPAQLKDGLSHMVTVKFTGTNADLFLTPQSVTCEGVP